MKALKNIKLKPNRKIVSFDVKSLYANVPVNEAIEVASTKLFDGENNENRDNIKVDKETFITLAKLACRDVVFSSPSVFFRQIDDLAIRIQPAPPLANIWMSSFEDEIKEDPTIFDIYVDDTPLDIEESEIDELVRILREGIILATEDIKKEGLWS